MSLTKVYDGDAGFAFGQDYERAPWLLAPGWFSRGINVRTRRGFIEPREGFHYCPLIFSDLRSKEIFERGKWQGAETYRDGVVAAVSGNIFYIQGGKVSRLTSDEDRFDQYVDRLWMTEAGNYFVIQDGVSRPGILSGGSFRRSDSGEVPVGRAMAYGNGRLFVVSYDCKFIYASNIQAFGLQDDEEILKFSESPFGFKPYGIGDIVGLAFLPQLSTTTGLGPLIAFGKGGAYAFDVTIPRDEWATSNFGSRIGADFSVVSHQVIQEHGGDLFFRTADGIETLGSSTRDFNDIGTIDLSFGVSPWLRNDSYLTHSDSSKHNNIIRWTVGHHLTSAIDLDGNPVNDICASGMVALDTANRANGGVNSTPVWDGLETGLCPLSLVGNKIFSKDCDGINRLYEITDSNIDYGPSGPVEIEWEFLSRGYDFQAPMNGKRLKGRSIIDLGDIKRSPSYEVSFRPDSIPCFFPWSEGEFCEMTCDGCLGGSSGSSYYRLAIGSPADQDEPACDPLTERLVTNISRVQVRLRVKGYLRLERIKLAAEMDRSGEETEEPCPDPGSNCATVDCCENTEIYRIVKCHGTNK